MEVFVRRKATLLEGATETRTRKGVSSQTKTWIAKSELVCFPVEFK